MASLIWLALGVGFIVFGFFQFKKVKILHDALDSVADARVTNVIDLGIGQGGKRLFAVEYMVLADEKFKILETPTTREPDIDDIATIYYEQKDPKKNFYITYKWNFDPRFKASIILILIGVLFIVSFISSIVKMFIH